MTADSKTRARDGQEVPDEQNGYVPDTDGQLILDDWAEDPDTKCGIGGFYPSALQMFANIGAFVGLYSASGLLTSTLNVYVNSQVLMLEKQFGFSSSETGLIMSCNDIGYLCLVLFAGYFARKVNIPRFLGGSTILFGISGILCALPYFLLDQSDYDIDVSSVKTGNTSRAFAKPVPMCDNGTLSLGETSCSDTTSEEAMVKMDQLQIKKVAFVLICIGMVIQGIGKSPRYPFVTLYIDDAVEKSKTGFYMGIIIGTGIFGPALGYLLGGLFSRIYVTLKDVPIGPRDPRWIGAWWLGFIVFGISSIFAGIPTFCFPRKLPLTAKRALQDNRQRQTHHKQHKSFVEMAISEAKGFVKSLWRLFKNPVYMLTIFSSALNLIGVAGILGFMPKYLAAQYTIPLWQANIMLAVANISSVSLGSFLGGVLTRRIKMVPRTNFIIVCLFMIFNVICMSSGFFLGADQPAMVGDNGRTDVSSELYQPLDGYSDLGCQCDDNKYFPICGDDGQTYFSPCHAGCSIKDGMDFLNCTAISTGRATGGVCDQQTSTKLYTYAAFTFIAGFTKAMKIIPTFIATVRCVDEKDRAVATAFNTFTTSTLGWMPGPVVMGALIDRTCSLWQYKCGERLSCQVYDLASFRNLIHGYSIGSTGIAIIPLVIVIYIVWNWKEWQHPDDAKNKANDVKRDVTINVTQ